MSNTWTCPVCGDGPYVDDPYGARMHISDCAFADGAARRVEKYEVIVGNIGVVYSGSSRDEAYHQFHAYVELSVDGVGRAAFEDVTLFLDGEPIKEHHGSIDNDEDFACHVDPRAWNYEDEE